MKVEKYEMHSVTELLDQYGYIVLFVSLLLELIAFPLPGEVLMTYCGVLVGQHKLNWMLSILLSAAGVIVGVTISYTIGRIIGAPFFKRYGHYIHLGADRLEKTSIWFDRYGDRLLLFTYFIPGVRHITGYFSGMSAISYKKFAGYSYTGAFIWTATFITLGNALGNEWEKYSSIVTRYFIEGSILITLIIITLYFFGKYKEQLIETITRILQNVLKTFHSLGKVKFMVTGVASTCLILIALMIGAIQDLLSNEFGQFDVIVDYLVKSIFINNWTWAMTIVRFFSSIAILLLVMFCTVLFILRIGKNKLLEIKFTIIVFAGGEVIQAVLRMVFRRQGPSELILKGDINYTFPSKDTFMAVAVFGFLCYFIIYYVKKSWIRVIALSITLAICFFCGIGMIYAHAEYPSDVYAGYVFGGTWLLFNIFLLEVYRILSIMKK